jgi:predicted DNA-binding transcriptional regulator AlpA
MNAPQVYTVRSFCDTFGLSRAAFYRLLARGSGPDCFHLGARTLITASAAAEWLKRMEQSNAGPAQRTTPRRRRMLDEEASPPRRAQS